MRHYYTQKDLFDTLEIGDIVTVNQEGYTQGKGEFIGYEECPNQHEEDDTDCRNCEGFIRLKNFIECIEKGQGYRYGESIFEDCVVNSYKKTYVTQIIKRKPIIFITEKEFSI